MKADGLTDNFSILVLSPSIDPPDSLDEGSIANTATLKPFFIKNSPNDSIKVDLPTPGTPVIPIRIELLFILKFSKIF